METFCTLTGIKAAAPNYTSVIAFLTVAHLEGVQFHLQLFLIRK